MAKSIFDKPTRQEVLDRIARLRPDSPRKFGKMTPSEMMCHMQDALRVATGEVPARQRKTIMANPLLRRIIIYYVPWPKGKAKTVPEMLTTRPADFAADRKRLETLLRMTADRGPNSEWAVHPAFGRLSGRDYGVLIYRHFDHHLKQFGV